MQNEETWQPLLMDGVEGEVFTMNLPQNDVYTVGRVKLMPHSKIPLHPHDHDCEWYWNEETGELVDFCPKGNSHCLVNDTNHIMWLKSIKKVE